MLKKMVVAFALLLFGCSLAVGEEDQKEKRLFKISGSYEAGYKVQNDFKSPWDADGELTEGAANRSKQPVTQIFDLTLTAIEWADGKVKYPEWLVLAQIEAKPNDPDVDESEEEFLDVGEAFLLWKPHIALEVKIGRQTLPQTFNGGHFFYGPIEFSMPKIGSVTRRAAGLTLGFNPGTPNHKLGVSLVNGSPAVSDLFKTFNPEHEVDEGGRRTTAVWYEGKMFNKALNIVFAQQTVEIVSSYVTDSEIRAVGDKHDQYGDYLTHTVVNLGVSYDFGFVEAAFGYMSISGDAIGPPPFGGEVRMEMSNTTLGLGMKDLGPGRLDFEYAPAANTPDFGEEGSAAPAIDGGDCVSLEYTIEMKENINMRLTYRQLNAGDYWTEGAGKDHLAASSLDWSPTSMVAISFKYEFGQ